MFHTNSVYIPSNESKCETLSIGLTETVLSRSKSTIAIGRVQIGQYALATNQYTFNEYDQYCV